MTEPKSPKKRKQRNDKGEARREERARKKPKLEEAAEEHRRQEPPPTRLLIVERLTRKGDDALTALQELAEATEEEDNDLVQQFFAEGGQAGHLVRVLELRDGKVKRTEVMLVFNAVQNIVKRVVRSEDIHLAFGGRGYNLALELTKTVLEDYGRDLVLLLSATNTTQQARSVLRMLTTMVTLGPAAARLILNKLNWDSPGWETLPKRSSRKENPDVRTCYIHFLLSFLVESNPGVIKDYFEKKTRLVSIFPGLVEDPARTVQLVLETLRSKLLENSAVSKTQKMKMFGSHNIKPLIALFNWTGPKSFNKDGTLDEAMEDEERQEDLLEVKTCLSEFLLVLLASTKHGVLFHDAEMGCEKSSNQLIAEVLRHLEKPWESQDVGLLVTRVLAQSPGQLPSFLDTLQDHWAPRASSPTWIKVVDLLIALYTELSSAMIAETCKRSSKIVLHILRSILVPVRVIQHLVMPGLRLQAQEDSQEEEALVVRRRCIELLDCMLQNVEQLLGGLVAFEGGEGLRTALLKDLRSQIRSDRLPSVELLLSLWQVEMRGPEPPQVAAHILRILCFLAATASRQTASQLNVTALMADIEKLLQAGSLTSEAAQALQLQALLLLTELVKKSENTHNDKGGEEESSTPAPADTTHASFLLLRDSLTEETFRILLTHVFSRADEDSAAMRQQAEASREILRVVMRRSRACLPEGGTDLQLVLLLGGQTGGEQHLLPRLARIMLRAVKNVESFQEELSSYQSLVTSVTSQSVSQLFDTLARDDFTPDLAKEWMDESGGRIPLSPLLLSLLDDLLEEGGGGGGGGGGGQLAQLVAYVIEALLLLLPDRTALCEALKTKSDLFSKDLTRKILLLSTPDMSRKAVKKLQWLSFLPTLDEIGNDDLLSHLHAARLLLAATVDDTQTTLLTDFLVTLARPLQAKILRSFLDSEGLLLSSHFQPLSPNCPALVPLLISTAKAAGLRLDGLASRFNADLLAAAVKMEEKEVKSNSVNRQRLLDVMTAVQLSREQLEQLFQLLASRPLHLLVRGCELSQLGLLLCGTLTALAAESIGDEVSSLPPIPERFSAAMEHVVAQVGREEPLPASSLASYLARWPAAAAHLTENLFYVCSSQLDRPPAVDLMCELVVSSDHFSRCLSTWLSSTTCKEPDTTAGVVQLLTRIFNKSARHQGLYLQDHLLTENILRTVLRHATTIKQEDNAREERIVIILTACSNLFTLLVPHLSGPVFLEILKAFYTTERDSMAAVVDSCRTDRSCQVDSCWLGWQLLVLGQLEQQQPGVWRKQLGGQLLAPLVDWLAAHLGPEAEKDVELGEAVRGFVNVGEQLVKLLDANTLRKRLHKSPGKWSALVKAVLKHGLKMSQLGAPCLGLLAAICAKKYRSGADGDRTEQHLIADMVHSHSGFLPLLLGPHSGLKLALLRLLLALQPASCTQEQVGVLLSGYTATLHPSDRAILRLLHRCQVNHVDLAEFKPLVFGKEAVAQYTAKAGGGGGWKSGKNSESLAILKPELMQRTALLFPLALPLQPDQEVEDEVAAGLHSDWDETLYDPRFILPFLSSVTGNEVYVDRHLKLVESGGLGLAIAALSSQDYRMRSMGYHILHRFHQRMTEAKFAAEKQIWLHLVSLIRNGLHAASKTKICLKLPSITTAFLVKSINILSSPLHPLYKAISSFLLAKPSLELFSVPEFLRLLHSKSVGSAAEQRWILELLRDGLRDRLDHQIYLQSYVYKLVLSQWASCLADKVYHFLVLDLLERAVSLRASCLDLVIRHGLLQWLIVALNASEVLERRYVMRILDILEAATRILALTDPRKQTAPEPAEAEEEAGTSAPRVSLHRLFRSSGLLVLDAAARLLPTDTVLIARCRAITANLDQFLHYR